ncbi:platelet-activating factor acetylhydrolase IB subunit beta homolog isoform X1 [Ixodes scapularis]|uniref:platelet-activating factor acetylhydrolase IB subunit beta homolog isoform X1 n=1 Tax=Ixodes scapularis TaxID=6945 RepID=UPI001C38F7BA|nr:platelet-activating factor acetylhydrolase IB subunit beta homolog isoform X1 [Ixodes scapularis]
MNPAAVPTPGESSDDDDRWMSVHKVFLTEGAEKEPDVVIFGDFTVAFLQQSEVNEPSLQLYITFVLSCGKIKQMFAFWQVWEKLFAPLHCLNFGIPEDRTQNALWRIENGELDNVGSKVVVLSVGCNNSGDSPEAVAEGVQACTEAIRKRLPNAQVVVLKLLPCGQKANARREQRLQVNNLLSRALKGQPGIQLVDLDPGFVRPDGTISHHDMFDFNHLSKQGYKAAFEPLAELLAQLLREAAGAGDPVSTPQDD